MKNHAAQTVSDAKYSERTQRFPIDTPNSKEAYFIRELFDGDTTLPAFLINVLICLLYSYFP